MDNGGVKGNLCYTVTPIYCQLEAETFYRSKKKITPASNNLSNKDRLLFDKGLKHDVNNWFSGWNVDFGYKRSTARTPASICFLLEQETLSALLQSTQL